MIKIDAQDALSMVSEIIKLQTMVKELAFALKQEAYQNIPNDKARIDNTKRVLAMIEDYE